MEKAILSVLSRAVKSKKFDSVGDVPAPGIFLSLLVSRVRRVVSCRASLTLPAVRLVSGRPPRREKRGKTQGVKARVASFSVEAAAQKTPITQLQEYCVNVLKTAPRYVTTTQGLAPLKLLEASRLIVQGDREKRWFRPLATQYSILFLFICPFISPGLPYSYLALCVLQRTPRDPTSRP
jgi:hypothetical protein